MKARIIRIISKEYTILSEDGQKYTALLSGKIRRQAIPAAGDLVEADINAGQVVIQKILPRRNHLIRPFVANVDQALIIILKKTVWQDDTAAPTIVQSVHNLNHEQVCCFGTTQKTWKVYLHDVLFMASVWGIHEDKIHLLLWLVFSHVLH